MIMCRPTLYLGENQILKSNFRIEIQFARIAEYQKMYSHMDKLQVGHDSWRSNVRGLYFVFSKYFSAEIFVGKLSTEVDRAAHCLRGQNLPFPLHGSGLAED